MTLNPFSLPLSLSLACLLACQRCRGCKQPLARRPTPRGRVSVRLIGPFRGWIVACSLNVLALASLSLSLSLYQVPSRGAREASCPKNLRVRAHRQSLVVSRLFLSPRMRTLSVVEAVPDSNRNSNPASTAQGALQNGWHKFRTACSCRHLQESSKSQGLHPNLAPLGQRRRQSIDTTSSILRTATTMYFFRSTPLQTLMHQTKTNIPNPNT